MLPALGRHFIVNVYKTKYLYYQSQFPKLWIWKCHSSLAQPLEHLAYYRGVVGSSPTHQGCVIFHFINVYSFKNCSQLKMDAGMYYVSMPVCLVTINSRSTGWIMFGMSSTLIWEGNLHTTAHNWMWTAQMQHIAFGAFGEISTLNTLRPRQNGRRFADDTFKRIFLNENARISIKISLKLVPKGPINNIPALVQIMAWRRSGDRPLSEPMMVSLLTHICVTRPQWVKRKGT